MNITKVGTAKIVHGNFFGALYEETRVGTECYLANRDS